LRSDLILIHFVVDNQLLDFTAFQETKISNESFSFLGKKQANEQTDESEKNSKEIFSLFKQLINKNELKEESFEPKPEPKPQSNDYLKRFISHQTTSDTSGESLNKNTKTQSESIAKDFFLKTIVDLMESNMLNAIYKNSIEQLMDSKNIQSLFHEVNVQKFLSCFGSESNQYEEEENTGRERCSNNCMSKQRAQKQRKIKKVSACEHTNQKHYAKNMCYNCYLKSGREKKAWKCKHVNSAHYAHGQCHNCYQIHHLKNIKEKVDFDIDDIYS